jgi:hypothetical protein
VLDLTATSWYSIETFFLAALEVEVIDRSIRESRHPKLSLVPAVFQSLANAGLPCLVDERKVDHGANIGIVTNELPLVGATTASDLAKKALASFAKTICSAVGGMFQIVEDGG